MSDYEAGYSIPVVKPMPKMSWYKWLWHKIRRFEEKPIYFKDLISFWGNSFIYEEEYKYWAERYKSNPEYKNCNFNRP